MNTMPPAAKLTFLALDAKESDVPLTANDRDIVAALDAYNAKYSKGLLGITQTMKLFAPKFLWINERVKEISGD